MLIEKQYKFYAAHRNEELTDKCRNLHGHRYGLRCCLRGRADGVVLDAVRRLRRQDRTAPEKQYDHALLINVHDPLYETLAS